MIALKKSKCRNDIIVISLLVGLLVIFGCIMVYSASFYSANYHYGNKYFFLFKQLLGVVLGVFAMIALTFIDYHLLNKYKWFIVGGTFLLLALVFVPWG